MFPFRNDSSLTVPPHAVLRVTGAGLDTDRRTFLTCEQPGGTFSRVYAVNGATPVAAGSYGACFLGEPAFALFEGGSPGAGAGWGPQPGSWKLHAGYYGFTILGGVNSTKGIVLAAPAPIDQVEGQANGAISGDGTGTVDVWTGAAGGADTTWDITAWNRYGSTAISSGQRVGCTWVGNVWVVRAAECEPPP